MSANNNDDLFGHSNDFYATQSLIYVLASGFAILGALSVLITGVLFWNQMVRNKIYMKLLMSMSVCDLIDAVTGCFGIRSPESYCKVQAACWFLFNRASWMYTAWMAITLFTHVTFGKVYVQFRWMNLSLWSINIFLFVLPLFASDLIYGGDHCTFLPGELYAPLGNVSLRGGAQKASALAELNDGDVLVWTAWLFFVPLGVLMMVPLVLIAYTRLVVYPKLVAINPKSATRSLRVISNVQYYPLLQLVFWFPFFLFCSLQNVIFLPDEVIGLLVTLVWSMLYPVAVGFYFFYRSSEARLRWRKLLGMKPSAHAFSDQVQVPRLNTLSPMASIEIRKFADDSEASDAVRSSSAASVSNRPSAMAARADSMPSDVSDFMEDDME